MVPHSLFVSSDRHVDFTLQLLTLLVSGALLATLAYCIFLWLRPLPVPADRGDVGPPVWAAMTDPLRLAPRVDLQLAFEPPMFIYRCEFEGHTTYSDRPCTEGRPRRLLRRPY